MKQTTKAEREKHVAQMRANHRIEGFKPDTEDLSMQQKYIDGAASLDDMLKQAQKFAESMRGKF